jgi:hypothetical protein
MTNPSCDRHKNVQMVPFSLEYPGGKISGHVCPVPRCGRHHVEEGYFDVEEDKLGMSNSATGKEPSVRQGIVNAIRAMAGMRG